MKKTLLILMALLLVLFSAAGLAEEEKVPEEVINALKEHCYFNLSGGTHLHVDPECLSVHERFRPLTEIIFTENLLYSFSPCQICTSAIQPEDQAKPAQKASEEVINALKEHCYCNLNGGTMLHTDPYCVAVQKRFQPLTEIIFTENLLDRFSACEFCTPPVRPEVSLESAQEIPEEVLAALNEHCYYVPDSGTSLHTDPNCKSVHPQYLPMQEFDFSADLLEQYKLCEVCTLGQ